MTDIDLPALDRELKKGAGELLCCPCLRNLAGQFLFGLDPRDARAYAVAMITLLAAALVAVALPARCAAGISPIEALRNE